MTPARQCRQKNYRQAKGATDMTTQQTEALQCAADLEAQLEAIGAGVVSGPLIGQPQAMPDLSQLTERGAKAWAGVDAQGLREALRRSTAADGKTELFNLPGYPLMVRAADFNRIRAESEMRRAALLDEMQKAALAAGQDTAAQPGVVYAELPVPNYPKSGGFPGTFAEAQMHAFADATCALRASHGQASSQAGEHPALVCDYCGALTPDPWHSSGMLHGKMSKHIHSCDACAARGAAKAQAAKQQEQLI